MKKTITVTETQVANAKTEKSTTTKKTTKKAVTSEVVKTIPIESAALVAKKTVKAEVPEAPANTKVAKAAPKKASPKPKPTKNTPAVDPLPITATPEISMHERVGLTAGSIWHYLTDNGATTVAKLVDVLSEEAAIIQRSIGWLAQEDKISISVVGQVETIVLKG